MHRRPSSQEIRHVARPHGATRMAAALIPALCAVAAADVGYGEGLEISLGRSGDAVEAPEWVQVFPEGPQIVARDGRSWKLTDPAALVAAFTRNKADLAADLNHASEILAPKGEAAPAQGWVKELQHRPGQGVWARVDWNAAGRAAIEGRQYRYVSPAFRHHKQTMEIHALTSIGLVTHPALFLPALAREGEPDPSDMDPVMTLRLTLIGALALAATATDDEILAAVTSQQSLARDARNPEKLVPASDLTAALARASTAETALANREAADKDAAAVTAVDAAVAEGKITPAGKDHWLSIARENPDGFSKAMAAQPALGAAHTTDTGKKPGGEDEANHGLDEAQLAVCRDMNLDPAAYAANLKKDA